MEKMLLGISPDYLYFHQGKIKALKDVHQPYFLSFPADQQRVEEIRKQTIKRWQKNQDSTSPLSYVSNIGEIEQYQSFWDFEKTWQVFKVFTKESFRVPEVSNHFFFNLGLYTAEHDIPYHQRALIDLLASGKTWLFDSGGKKERLKLLVYDIEIADFQPGRIDLPIDVIGYAEATIDFSSSLDLKTEDFRFDIHNTSEGIDGSDVVQLVSKDVDEEIKNLVEFCQLIKDFDIISGHNITGFDNRQIYGRIQWLLKNKKMMLSGDEKKVFQDFLSKQTRLDKSFHFGMGSDVIQMYPCTFDTYLASRKFYPYLESHSLKAVAPFLDVGVADRLILKPSEIGTDEKTLRYNAHDVIEQMGVTLHLIQQALPLSFTTGMPFETLLSSGAVSMWDHMALLRGGVQKKIIPAICRVNSICKDLLSHCNGCQNRKDIIKQAKLNRDQLSKEFIRVLKYGEEMPEWMLYPYVVVNDQAESADERMNYHMPGGMTIKPDKDAHSDFIPWYKVVVADVGAMYPTILKALNIGADTVRICPHNEDPDMWVWFKRLPSEFFEKIDVKWRKITEKEGFADKGFMIGVKINKKPGVVNGAMTGIMSMIQQIKNELQSVQSAGNSEELKRLKMMYQSVKGARNAGSVDYDQRIMLINPDGEYDPRRIGEFVDDAIQKYESKIEVINGTRFEVAEVADKWSAVSVSKDGKTEIKPVTKAVRHQYDKKLVRITTKSGFTVVTPNHSLFTVKNNQLSMIDANELDDNTSIIHSKQKLPSKTEKSTRYDSEKAQEFRDCFAIPPKKIEYIDSSSDYVYDISVEDNENFVDANGGIVLHNTHGILAAPNVSGRQFNLWGACAITTKGQVILDETLKDLEKKDIRVTYGDTDGIYLGCSRSVAKLPDFAKALGIQSGLDEDVDWLTSPDDAVAAIDECNSRWQEELNYAEFELEPEYHDAMVFVKHKNYLIFDEQDGLVQMNTKGNNFKGSDKANVARKALKEIMLAVLKDIPTWVDEEEARLAVRESIRRHTQKVVSSLDFSKVDIEDLTLIQSVKPASKYKRNQDGGLSTFGKRAAALEKVMEKRIRSRTKYRFVVTKNPLPGIANPSKSGVKPIDYMYPVNLLEDKAQIDLEWYKEMVENYIQGAFGLPKIGETEQTGLDSWM